MCDTNDISYYTLHVGPSHSDAVSGGFIFSSRSSPCRLCPSSGRIGVFDEYGIRCVEIEPTKTIVEGHVHMEIVFGYSC